MASSANLLPYEVPLSGRLALPVAEEVKTRAIRALAKWVDVAQDRLCQQLLMPTISFDLTGKTASIAFGGTQHLQLNPELLEQNLEQFESRVIPHELAHLIVARLHGKRVALHGEEWLATMHALGVEPEIKVPLKAAVLRVAPPQEADLRAPSAAMLVYATGLAERHRIELPAAVMKSFAACTAFLQEWSHEAAFKNSGELPLLPGRLPSPAGFSIPAPPAARAAEPPTDKQVAYASNIAKRKNLDIPAEVLQSKSLISKWIADSQ